jgi:hypothetical protein
LTPPTSLRHVLIATQSFADLPGAPTPDYIIPAGMLPFFFDPNGDLISYVPWDSWSIPHGWVPLDCVQSLTRPFSIGPPSPTNYAGQTGAFDACPRTCTGDANNSGEVDVDDLIAVILDWGCVGSQCAGDVDDSGEVDVDDLIVVILNWGPC